MHRPRRNDLAQKLGISSVRKLYLQLLYRCNFNCVHCFHGEKLKSAEMLAPAIARRMISQFATEHGTARVCLLGGEPLVYPHLAEVAAYAAELGLEVELCTNGYKRRAALNAVLPSLTLLRVSIDGDRAAHDAMRREGSYDEALDALRVGRRFGVATGVTTTVTKANARTLKRLWLELAEAGVGELVLHRIRAIGNAKINGLEDIDASDAQWLAHELGDAGRAAPSVKFDSDILSLIGQRFETALFHDGSVDRVEIAPSGEVYLSCKVVGSGMNSLRYAFETDEIICTPHAGDELAQKAPQVNYVGAA